MIATNQETLELVLLTSIDTESQFKIREIRNEENVRKWMREDHIVGANEYLGWINQLKQDDKRIVFVILSKERIPLGVINIHAMDRFNKKTDFDYYVSETVEDWLCQALEHSIINFIFDVLGMEKLNCEVIEGNDALMNLHKKFFFQEEGIYRSAILKNGVRRGIHLLGLTKEDWLAGKNEIQEQYKRVFAKYSVSILWQPDEKKDLHPIDQIEAARARNNLNWMSILRLALEKSPQTAKPIVAEIKRIDREISALTDKLTE